jgi:hypothetical protein
MARRRRAGPGGPATFPAATRGSGWARRDPRGQHAFPFDEGAAHQVRIVRVAPHLPYERVELGGHEVTRLRIGSRRPQGLVQEGRAIPGRPAAAGHGMRFAAAASPRAASMAPYPV